jgi:hypothetical protein
MRKKNKRASKPIEPDEDAPTEEQINEWNERRAHMVAGYARDCMNFINMTSQDFKRGSVSMSIEVLPDGSAKEGYLSFLQFTDNHMMAGFVLLAKTLMGKALKCESIKQPPLNMMCDNCADLFMRARRIANTASGREPEDDGDDLYDAEHVVRTYTEEEIALIQATPASRA